MNNEHVLALGDLIINKDSHEVFIKTKKINLRRKEYDLLEFLALNHNRVLNRFSILEYVWNHHLHSDTNTLEVHMNTLRKKIKTNNGRKMITTVHGIGYKLAIPEVLGSSSQATEAQEE